MVTFETGVAAIQVGEDERAASALERLVELAPAEPAATANLALLAFQQGRYEDAAEQVARALDGAPDDARVRLLAAMIERARGRLGEAIDHTRRANDDVRARWLLATLLEERAARGDLAESRSVLDELVAAGPAGEFLPVTLARHAARHGDTAAFGRALDALEARASAWPPADRAALDRVRGALPDLATAGAELTLLEAGLEALAGYAEQRAALTISEQQPDLVVTEFVLLTRPSSQPAAPDLQLGYVSRAIAAAVTDALDVQSIGTDAEARLAILVRGAVLVTRDTAITQRVALPPAAGSDASGSFAVFDFDHDFRLDLAVVYGGRLSVLRQAADGRFAVEAVALPARANAGTITAVWAADADLDGDIDLVLAARDASPFVLRNRGDGGFDEVERFDGLVDVRDFVWGDANHDGVPDASFVDGAGAIHVFGHPRQDRARFDALPAVPGQAAARAIALGDLDADGRFELIVLRADGTIESASLEGGAWRTRELARWAAPAPGPAGVRVADLDNNGALDLAASAGAATRTWLADSTRSLVAHDSLSVLVTAAVDLTSSGRIELLGIDAGGVPVRATPRPARDYFALTLIPRATDQPGDRRINTFGIGGEAEIRAGLLYQKQPIQMPVVHFGLGPRTGVTVARIVWPNGTAQAEFDLLASQGTPIIAEQRLKGSCPWLFAFDGSAMRFVTDVAWRSALGLRINAVGSSAVVHSEDHVRVRGDQLAEQDGFYELRVTGELWESHFFDHVALLVVDHPAGTEVFVDERFTLPPPDTRVHLTRSLEPIAAARDDAGRDVTERLAARDERTVDGFALGAYQGTARGVHAVEVELGPGASRDAPLLLVAHGWVQPTDGSINFALGQGSHAALYGVRVEVPDASGAWKVLHADLGMPAGKSKTVLIDLKHAFEPAAPLRVRLSTNMEIYWDHIAWTEALPDTQVLVEKRLADHAELRYRGFSRVHRAGRRAPELPDYEVTGTAPHWADLTGWHTRFGDVRPLLEAVDDRYVIMNAGDEMALRFAAPPPSAPGQVRDFVFVSDAWVKDGDFNNGFSSTVLPLPYHGLTDYATPPGRLEDDPAFRMHPGDWLEYHSRRITPHRFRHALAGR